MKTSVGADDQTKLLAKPSKVKVDKSTGNEYKNKGTPMLCGAVLHPVIQLWDRNKIGEKEVGNGQ